ncbi:MAG: hypothetical protein HY899_07810 [Deltaproteobacteria bacterium]|nr:hypothetical protein [Deltaproteobacteria bacterium]
MNRGREVIGLPILALVIAASSIAFLLQPMFPAIAYGGDGEVSVLMIGNSLSNGIKQPLVKLAKSRGVRMKISALMKNGATLGTFADSTATAKKIAAGPWDHVILQEQSAGTFSSRYPDARALDAMIREAGSHTMFFLTWRDRGELPATYGYLRGRLGGDSGYVPIAYELDASIAPVGWAFRDAVIDGIYDALWEDDGHHAGKRGEYLAAAVFYTMIFEESPVGLWAPNDFSIDEAVYYQELAAKVVFGEIEVWSSSLR